MTLLPINSKWPWITAAQFRPELVPEELMAQGLTVCNLILHVCIYYFLLDHVDGLIVIIFVSS